MSRSRRHTPITGVTAAASDKGCKTRSHRAERAATRVTMAAGEDAPHPKAFGDPWKANKDGKTYFGRDAPGMMRK